MRFYTLSALIAIAAAETNEEEVNKEAIEYPSDGDISVVGEIGEYINTGADGSKSAGVYMNFVASTEGDFDDGSRFQFWKEMEDSENPGTFKGMMCTALW